jgi:hypothetical protein
MRNPRYIKPRRPAVTGRSRLAIAICVAGAIGAIAAIPANAGKPPPPDQTATLVGNGVGLNFQETADCDPSSGYNGYRTSHEVWQKNGKLVAHAAGTFEFYNDDGSGGFTNICGDTFGFEIFSDNGVAFKTGSATDAASACVGFVDPSQPVGSRVSCEEGGGGLQNLRIVRK